MGWYEDRFQPHPGRVECACLACGKPYWLPRCEVQRRKTCGTDCAQGLAQKIKEARRRDCKTCGATFVPRSTQLAAGEGQFCSIRCSTYGNGQLWTSKARAAANASTQKAVASGQYTPANGSRHVQWKGGAEATLRRRVESGKAAEQLRRYRAANPDFQRECRHRRRELGMVVDRLPRGTVKRIGESQRWKCACCKVDVQSKYHVDHIQPLARGGKHEPKNLQLLCATCNLKKSAKDPISFMQSMGFLL